MASDDFEATERLIAALAEARQVIREAHEATKDLKHWINEARTITAERVTNEIDRQLLPKVVDMQATIERAMRTCVERVDKSFTEMSATLLGQDRTARKKGKPSIPELVQVIKTMEQMARHESVHEIPDAFRKKGDQLP